MSKWIWGITIAVALAVTISSVFIVTLYPVRYRDEIAHALQKFDVPPEIIASVIKAESGFRKNAKSSQGAVGLMQLMPSTARFIAPKAGICPENLKLEDPHTNILLGTAYLRYLMDKFDDLRTVFAAYNAGQGNVSRWLNSPQYSKKCPNREDALIIKTTPYRETNAYVERVINSIPVYRFRMRNM